MIKNIEKPIFIHSWFRSGSTYIWSKFRTLPDLVCYYEPLHEKISRFDHAPAMPESSVELAKKLRHSFEGEDYFFEYQNLKGNLNFKPQISYDRYILSEESDEIELKTYLQRLINHAQASEKQALLSFCRSQLRSAWMRHNFDATHIATIRNPLDQWNSFNINWYFIDKVFRVSHSIQLCIPDLFKPIPRYHDFLKLISDKVPSQINSYPVHQFSHEEVFSIFLIIWLLSSLHSMNLSDYTVDIDALSESLECKKNLSIYLSSLKINLNFDDCNCPADVSKNSNHDALKERVTSLISQWPSSIRTLLSSYHVINKKKIDQSDISKLNHTLLQCLKD